MKHYAILAVSPEGALVRSQELAASKRDLDHDLFQRGLVLVDAHEADHSGGRLQTRELIAFTTQLAVTVEAGVPLLEALEGIAKRATRQEYRRVLERLVLSLRSGLSLSEAMERESESFPVIYRASIRAGEASGSLPKLLRKLASYIEWQDEVRGTVRKALIYPAFLALALLGLVVLMLTFLIPRVVGLMPGGREQLPLPTRLVLTVSDLVLAGAPYAIGLAVTLAIAAYAMRRNQRWIEFVDRTLLRIPALGSMLHQVATSRFAAVASTLQAAGCEIRQVIAIGADSCGNAALAASFRRAGEAVQRGKTLTEGLERERLTDPLLLQLVAVGESAGDLDGCLQRLSAWYDQELPRRVKRFLAVLEPSLILVSALVVGFLLLAALLPIFKLYESLA